METKTLELAGKTYKIAPTYWSLMLALEQLNKNWSSDNTLASIAANVFACIVLQDETLTLEAVAKLMPCKNMQVAIADVTKAIEGVMAEAKEGA